MMAALMSSPMGPPARFDLFEQPSSPSYTQEELPADFDRSFGSSMSISSSFDGSHIPQIRLGGQSHNGCFGSGFTFTAGQTSLHTSSGLSARDSERISPRRGPSLGAAMGTFLNTRSPGLAAKLSSPMDMDISPSIKGAKSPSSSTSGMIRSLGDARRKSHTVVNGPSPLSQAPRKPAERSASPATASLGRLFGTELSLNQMKITVQEDGLLSSPDKEPPPKRRPSSLPLRQVDVNQRTTSARTVNLKANAPAAAPRPRPALLKRFTEDAQHDGDNEPLGSAGVQPRHRLSDSSLATAKSVRKPRSRAASSDSLFCDQEDAGPAVLYDTIIEYPTPSPSKEDGIGSYFFDPQSPAHQALAAKKTSGPSGGPRPKLMKSLSSSSSPVSSPSNRLLPPKPTLLGPRTFEKTHSTACVPTQGSLAAGSNRTSLGKRANPYSKRPLLIPGDGCLKSAYPVLGMPGRISVTRPTAPAPRRCHSAMDNSSFLSGAGLASIGRIPASPERKPASMLDYSEMADANGSPIAPKSRGKSRPGLLRRASKDDSSPLGYGTGMKRSGSRPGDNMVDDLGLEDVAQVHSPFGAEGMPGFGASEKEGKVLPCFTVKNDGLMRISTHTLTDLLRGKYSDQIAGFNVVDCRFGYEYEGGHVPGAINLNTMEQIKNYFLQPGQGQHANGAALPARSQSGKPDRNGNMRKHILVFHCEFSCKRAPSMALALRQADRALAQDYPNCHFPEIYILQGGYCEYFRTYAPLCEPQQYVRMDDPRYQDRRSLELNGFRKQFARHRSFTYGEAKSHAGGIGRSQPGNPSIREEDLSIEESPCATGGARLGAHLGSGLTAADTSFGSVGDSSFEEEVGNSPCAAAGSRRPSAMLLAGPSFAQSASRNGSLSRRVMQRAGTTANILSG
ncbi:m-phase inducer phosphatase [Thecaphora frezii]